MVERDERNGYLQLLLGFFRSCFDPDLPGSNSFLICWKDCPLFNGSKLPVEKLDGFLDVDLGVFGIAEGGQGPGFFGQGLFQFGCIGRGRFLKVWDHGHHLAPVFIIGLL